MKHAKIILIIMALSFVYILNAQEYNYKEAWKQVEELNKKGLPAEASDKIDMIYQQATKEQISVQKVKCLIYKSNARILYEEEAIERNIQEIKQELQKAEGVEEAMLLVALSDSYQQYYYQHQWEIRDRQEVAGSCSQNITEWSQRDFNQQIDSLLQQALAFADDLQQTASVTWKEVFITNEDSFVYQPFLYDFVVWKALDFYTSDEFAMAASEDLVLLNDPVYFQSFQSFSKAKLSTGSLSYKEISLQLFQDIIHFHQGRKDLRPLFYEEVERLTFIEYKGVIDEKEDLLIATLEQLLKDNEGVAGVEIIAKKLTDKYRYSQDVKHLQKADKICKVMIQHGRNTTYFKSLSEQIHQKDIFLDVKDAVIPHQPSLASIRFKNTANIWFRIISIDADFEQQHSRSGDLDLKTYLNKPVIKQFDIKASDKASFLQKSALFELPSLDFGHYLIIASTGSGFDIDKDRIIVRSFWVSRMEVVSQKSDGDFVILDRQSGKTLSGVEVKVFSNTWEYSSRSNVKTQMAETKSDKEGAFSISAEKGQNRITLELSKGADFWETTSYVQQNNVRSRAYEKHYFFTDRAIYRPGQTVYFKGVFTEKQGDEVRILPNLTKEIFFYTPAGKQSIELTSNDFGSVSGSFVIPQSGLNGHLRIADDKGSIQFRVEAYKRPKFELILQHPEQEYALNEQIEVKGNASYFAGIALQNAQIIYRVVRTDYMPWRWTYLPLKSLEIPVAAGKTKTDDTGDFSIDFKALAPENIKGDVWYNYKVTAEVTDETGETHQQTISIRLGNKSLFITTDLLTTMDREFAKDVTVSAQTPNGNKIDKELEFKLEKLQSPKHMIAQTDWLADTILLSQQEIEEKFGHIILNDQPKDFEIEAVIFIKTLNTKTDSIIPKSIFKSLSNGVYKMTLSTTDKDNREVQEVKYFDIFSSQSAEMPFNTDHFFDMQNSTVAVGDRLRFSFGTSFKKQAYYYQLSKGNQVIESGWKTISKEMKHWEIPVTEDYRGGMSLQIFFMHQNRFYSFDKQITVPYDNKKLDIQLITSRHIMQTGSQEDWALSIKHQDGVAVSAEVLASMYDASLDVFAKHQWHLWPYQGNRYTPVNWVALRNSSFSYVNKFNPFIRDIAAYETLKYKWEYRQQRHEVYMAKNTGLGAMMDGAPQASMQLSVVDEDSGAVEGGQAEAVAEEEVVPLVSPRKNLNETAFFFPHLQTDQEGNLSLKFTSPEALSRWKLMILATTKDFEIGSFEQEFMTQKELMVMPNLPRFLRGGDRIQLSTKIINMLDGEQEVTARLEILDAKDMRPLYLTAPGSVVNKTVNISAKGQETVKWMIKVPEKIGAVIVRIFAEGNHHTDTEEHLLPVLSQLQFVTNTFPFTLSEQDNITKSSLGLKEKTYLDGDMLTLEITTHPLWYVVQALPDYAIPQQPSAVSWFEFYYINALAQSVIDNNPQIESVIKQWQIINPEELQSDLLQNQDLKQILLEETPWVKSAESQTRRKYEIALLFNKNNIQHQLEMAINRLKALQTSNGGWPWYTHMKTSLSMTAKIVEGLGQLKNQGVLDFTKYNSVKGMTQKAVRYLDDELLEIYHKEDKNLHHYQLMSVLKARSYFLKEYPLNQDVQTAYNHYLEKETKSWNKKELKQQMALTQLLWLSERTEEAQAIIKSLKDKSLKDANGGIYWRDLMSYNAPENQAAMIELFELADEDDSFVNGLKIWLLQQKRANDWGSGTATAKACYAMLSGTSSLDDDTKVFLKMNGISTEIEGDAGLGYYKVSWAGKDIWEKLNGLQIYKKGNGLVFGAFYEQYFARMKDIQSHDGGVKLEKTLYVAGLKEGKSSWQPLSDSDEINLGDRVLVRLTLNNQQAMDFVHLRDYLPAGFENKDAISVYKWKGNMAYYQSPNDIATDFFIDHLPKGKFVIEYELNASISGYLNIGPADIQSLYAPEFSGHSDGGEVIVRGL